MKMYYLIILLIIGVSSAFGHPFTEDTNPSHSANVPSGIKQITVTYSESIDEGFSALKVFDSNGNQIDNKDSMHYKDDKALIITTPPLRDGVYTVTSKVLSNIDGHLVNDAFVFAVGNVIIPEEVLTTSNNYEVISFPEAGARFPGLVGQTIILGGIISSILIWVPFSRMIKFDKKENTLHKIFSNKMVAVLGFGLILVLISDILMLAVQTIRLDTSAINAIQTNFGMIWLVRVIITGILFALWFWIERKQVIKTRHCLPILGASLVLIATTTLISHGAASEQISAMILDYIHNLIAAVWIGGLVFFGFIILPVFKRLPDEQIDKLIRQIIPRFSILFTGSIAVIIFTGPILLWLLEDDLGLIVGSTYGSLIIAKIIIGVMIISFGGYHQFIIPKLKNNLVKRMKKTLKIEIFLGVAILFIVALLTNGSLPAGEVESFTVKSSYGYNGKILTGDVLFKYEIYPFIPGNNVITVTVTERDGTPIEDLEEIKIKISNPQRGISPIITDTIQLDEDTYRSSVIFGFSGLWNLDIEAKRIAETNEAMNVKLMIRPQLQDLQFEIIEYELPLPAGPKHIVYDKAGSFWLSDSTAPRLWKFTPSTNEFEMFEFDGRTSILLATDGTSVWFSDPPMSRIGVLNIDTSKIQTIEIPKLLPLTEPSVPIAVGIDGKYVWVSVINKNTILRYDTESEEFEKYTIPTAKSGPFSILVDEYNDRIWFTSTSVGKIGFIDKKTDEIIEFTPDFDLRIPEAILQDNDGNFWIAEHDINGSLVRFNVALERFQRIPITDYNALANGMTFDKYRNVWFAQHITDNLGVYDPYNDVMTEVAIPTKESWVQFMITDDKQNVWFAEEKGNRIGKVVITELPSSESLDIEKLNDTFEIDDNTIRYSEIAFPIMAIGILGSAILFTKSVQDFRKNKETIIIRNDS